MQNFIREKKIYCGKQYREDGGLDRDTVEDLWRRRKRKGQKKGDKNGFCNADRLQSDENGIAALCSYLAKQPSGKKRWTSSQNLHKPV